MLHNAQIFPDQVDAKEARVICIEAKVDLPLPQRADGMAGVGFDALQAYIATRTHLQVDLLFRQILDQPPILKRAQPMTDTAHTEVPNALPDILWSAVFSRVRRAAQTLFPRAPVQIPILCRRKALLLACQPDADNAKAIRRRIHQFVYPCASFQAMVALDINDEAHTLAQAVGFESGGERFHDLRKV